MQQANLNQDGTYFLFQDGKVLANPLNSASHQWCAMIHHLRNDRLFQIRPELIQSYISSSVAYLVTFPMQSVVNTIFKYPTPHSVLASNFHNRAWKKISVPSRQTVPLDQVKLILGLIKTIVERPQPDRFLSERIGVDHPFFNEFIKPFISHRKILAVVMSLLPGSFIDKLGEQLWLCVLDSVANDNVSARRSNPVPLAKNLTLSRPQVSPEGFPERYLREIAIGPQAHPEILRKLKQRAVEFASRPVAAQADVRTETQQIIAEAFGARDPTQLDRRIYGQIYDRLGDIPAEILGDLGEPLYLKKRASQDPTQPRELAAYVFPRLHPEQPAPATWSDPQHSVIVVPVRKDLFASILEALPALAPGLVPAADPAPPQAPAPPAPDAPALDFPSAALDPPDAGSLPYFTEQGLLPEFNPEEPPREEEPDPFANFSSQPEDYDAWLMQVSSAAPDDIDDDEQGPAKRARTAEPDHA